MKKELLQLDDIMIECHMMMTLNLTRPFEHNPLTYLVMAGFILSITGLKALE
jgi:hypothetical protein